MNASNHAILDASPLSSELDKAVYSYYRKYYQQRLGIPNWRHYSLQRLHEETLEQKRIEQKLVPQVGLIRDKKILNVGCGTGGFNVAAHRKEAKCWGIEPDPDAIAICHLKAKIYNIPENTFIHGTAENIPFPDNDFDIVYCFTVLEHVQNVSRSLEEMLRVLRPGGFLYIHSPHYFSFYEGHYKIFWCPIFLIRPIAVLYLHLLRRPSAFLKTINFTTNHRVSKCLPAGLNLEVRNIRTIPSGWNHNHRIGAFIDNFIRAVQNIFRINSHVEMIIQKRP